MGRIFVAIKMLQFKNAYAILEVQEVKNKHTNILGEICMIRFTRKRALVCGAAAFVAAAATFAVSLVLNSFSVFAATPTVTYNSTSGRKYYSNYFTINGAPAYCSYHDLGVPTGNMSATTVDVNSESASALQKQLYKIVYYGQTLGYTHQQIAIAINNANVAAGVNPSGAKENASWTGYNFGKIASGGQVNGAGVDGNVAATAADLLNTASNRALPVGTNMNLIIWSDGNSGTQNLTQITYSNAIEEKFNLSVSKTWNDTTDDPNVSDDVYDVFNNNNHTELVPHSANIRILFEINATFNGTTKTIKTWNLGSDSGFSASQNDIGCKTVKNDYFGVSNDYSCSGLTLTATETPVLAIYQSPTLYASTFNPSTVTVTNGGTANFVFNNEFYTTFVNLTKTWEDNNSLSNDERPHYIDFDIKYRLKGSQVDTWETFKTYAKVETNCSKARHAQLADAQKDTICRAATENFTFDNLPAFLKINGQFQMVEYKAFETKLYDADENDITANYTQVPGEIIFADSDQGRITTQALTNTDLTTLPVKKIWVGDENHLEDRPTSITVALMCGDDAVLDDQNQPRTLVLNEGNNWEGEFTGLSSGECANYSVEETTELAEYTSVMSVENGVYTFRNYHDIDVRVRKQWTGDEPDVDSLTVNLICWGDRSNVLATATLNAGNNWSYTWTGRDYNECGGESEYLAYEANYSGDFKLSGTITHRADDDVWEIVLDNYKKIDIPVEKKWEGRSEDMRLTEVTTVLLCEDGDGNVAPYPDIITGGVKEVVLNAGNDWRGTFTEILASNCEGLGIAERSADGSLLQDGEIVTTSTATAGDFKFKVTYSGNAAGGFTITNEQLIDIPVEKVWDDDNADKRATGITALLMCDKGNGVSHVVDSHILDASNNWSWTWTNRSTSECDSYSVSEAPWEDHRYDTSYYYETAVTGSESTKFTITNTKYINMPVIKVWNYRTPSNIPNSIQIALTCNGSDVGNPVTLNKTNTLPSGAWFYDGFNHLKASDCQTGYSVREIIPAGANYNATVSTVSDYSRSRLITNTEQITIPVEKRWDGGQNDDLPDYVDVALYCDNDNERTAVEINGVAAQLRLYKSQSWRGEFTGLTKDSCEGEYDVEEVTEVEGFEPTVTSDENGGFVITNTKYTHLTVNKTWEKRDTTEIPRSLWLQLVCVEGNDRRQIGSQVTMRPDENGNWSYTFDNLKVSECANYDVDEYLGYNDNFQETAHMKVDATTVNLTNKEIIYVPIQKYWSAAEDTVLPDEIEVSLFCGATDSQDNLVDTLTLRKSSDYYGVFGPFFYDSCESGYNVQEDTILADFGVSIEEDANGYGFTITNTEQVDLTVRKVWENTSGKQISLPFSVQVALWCETTNSEVENERVTLYRRTGYSSGWNNLDAEACAEYGVREIAADGTTILSTVGDRYDNYFFYAGVSGSAAEGFTLTNTYDGVEISGTKTWVFTDDYGNTQSVSKRPVQIYVTLKQNGAIVDTATVRADGAGNWNFNFDNWPKYDANGDEYVYTVDETAIAYYAKTINGYNITNKYQPEYTSVTASKDWATLKDTELPDQVEVKLFCGDTDLQNSKYITKASNWASVRWDNLDALECEAGYRVEEVLPEGYAKSVTVGSNNEYIFTNAETVNIPVSKTWVKRETTALPESVNVALFCALNGQRTQLDEQTLSAANNWTYIWTQRNVKNDNCQGGAYVVDETSVVPNFQKTNVSYTDANGYVIENTELTSQKVIKVWEGDTNQNRPGSITAELMCGDVVKKTEVLSEANNLDGDNTWEYEWTNLLVSDCEQGYSVRESFDIPSYKTSYETLEDGTVVITNKRTTSQKVIKVWKNDDETKRPGYIEASLMCGDTVLDTVKLTKENDLDGDGVWEYEWTDLLVSDCEQGYTVDESINIPNYQKTVKVLEDGTVVITNEFDNPNTADKTAAGFGRIAGISSIVLIAGYFMTKRIMSRR